MYYGLGYCSNSARDDNEGFITPLVSSVRALAGAFVRGKQTACDEIDPEFVAHWPGTCVIGNQA